MIVADELRKLLHYNPETGVFTWLPRAASTPQERRWNTRYADKRAGTIDDKGYTVILIAKQPYKAHRLVWLYVHGGWPTEDIDHINGTPADNRIANLRTATASQNLANSRTPSINTSGFKGVSWRKDCGRWTACLGVAGKRHRLGLFDTPAAAHAAYMAAAREHFGEFARAG